MPFQQFGLPASLLRNILALGYVTPTPIQTQAIPVVQSGRDVVATAQTGTGKTAAFLLPVLHKLLEQPPSSTAALILTPTRELAQQINVVFRGLSANTRLRSALITGGAPMGPQERALRDGVEVIVATPGRLLDHLRKMPNAFAGLRTLILDEADQMFDLGFLPDLERIIGRLPAQRQNLLFSATMPTGVTRLARAILRNPATVTVGKVGATATSVTQTVYPVPAHRKTALVQHLLGQMQMPSVLIFTRTRRGARKLARVLAASGHGVDELHSDRTPAQRARAMQGFRSRAFPVLVATNIAARGLDVDHVTHVINFDVPHVPEEYVHRIGRTGRAARTGDAFVLVSPEENDLLAKIERQLGQRIPRQKLEDFDYNAPAPANFRPERTGGRSPSGPRRQTAGARSQGLRKPARGPGSRTQNPRGQSSRGQSRR